MEKLEKKEIIYRKLMDDYDILFPTILGEGAYGQVLKCQCKYTKKICALKTLEYRLSTCVEIDLHYRLSASKYIVSILDVFKEDVFGTFVIYLVMECMTGGTLYQHFMRNKKYPEKTVAKMMYQICKGVEFMHYHNIAHRDLKPGNIFLSDNTPDAIFKISDFSFAEECLPEIKMLKTKLYTKEFVAPEVLISENYDKACDIWSLGVLIYLLISGDYPFCSNGSEDPEMTPRLQEIIIKGAYDISAGIWEIVSQDAKDLIALIFNMDPDSRPKIDEILAHKWIMNERSAKINQINQIK